jgi:hypothetical protein
MARLMLVWLGHPVLRKTFDSSLSVKAGSLVEFSLGPHAHRFWLKSVLLKNISCMSFTLRTSHPEIS